MVEPNEERRENINQIDMKGRLALVFMNFGRTRAFAIMKHVGAWFDGVNLELRIDPDTSEDDRTRFADVDYFSPNETPFNAREIRYEIEAHGALGGTLDKIVWVGELALL